MKSINTEKIEICEKKILVAKELICLIDNYLSLFDKTDFFNISSADSKKNAYSSAYYSFISKFPDLISLSDGYANQLAFLLKRADKEMNMKEFKDIDLKLEAYKRFKIALAEYTEQNENAILSSKASISLSVNSALKLKMAINTLISGLSY